MERDDVGNRAKVGRLPEYLVRPGISQTAILRSTRNGPRRSMSHLGAAVEFGVIRLREPIIWLMQLK
jgi:hypothetical protein